ncbi:Uncharacterized membrane protein YpjA [Halorubrum aquaticum]|uniref:Uncharacterized membrane protein YpjA n=1 Tax=Halorubrum aquaticum TaxID=387340 RepID=A0A1I2Z2X9_9EURY|nr:DUF1405 domain-containing protein [Halorubrum aquaticum]SFH32227.1 Uncharacterized membrane protein YpjA [Halorubrum aquaticum]
MDIDGALGRDPPERGSTDGDRLPRWVAPLPAALEDVAYRFVWVIVAINLLGTAFGFWYYRFQFARVPVEMWMFVPDSPGATLLIALALASWAVGRGSDTLAALAFFGNIKLGLWTPYVLVVFYPEFLANSGPALYAFLFVSHLGMVVQAFVLHRMTDFPVRAVAVATAWYTLDLLMDYFVPVIGEVTHTSLPYSDAQPWFTSTVLQVAAAGAVVLTVVPVFLALATRVETLRTRA